MKILFFTPTGARTGSEMVIWYLINHLKNSGIQSAVYAREAGELFAKHSPADATFFNKFHKGLPYYVAETVYHRLTGLTPEERYIQHIHRKFNPDLWYFNTITMPQFSRLATKLNVPYLVHAHELTEIYDSLRADAFAYMLEHAQCTVGCSSVVVEKLAQMGTPNLQLLHSFIDTAKIQPQANAQALKQQLGIPADAFVWLMSGTMCLRKGYDMLPDLLTHLPKNTYIVWLGSKSEYGISYYLEQRVQREELNFRALGAKGQQDYYDYLNMADGFVLTSREDPFPLVMIEAAYLQKPIVGFNSGGISEFVQEGMGQVVPAFDIPQLAAVMQHVMNGDINISPEKLRQRAAEFDVKAQLPKWKDLFEGLKK
ncbi:MAG: glycosyltransferase family 4 protein [Spirosomaceae bacterium]|jgi:glycosyltransferase involved in cell wall biosynthesis|nr:glycosyltransferase family 4 protein [Spirosomataceae bacterium]